MCVSKPHIIPCFWWSGKLTSFNYSVKLPHHVAAIQKQGLEQAKNWEKARKDNCPTLFKQLMTYKNGYDYLDAPKSGMYCWVRDVSLQSLLKASCWVA